MMTRSGYSGSQYSGSMTGSGYSEGSDMAWEYSRDNIFTDREGNRRGINQDYWYYTDREGDVYGPWGALERMSIHVYAGIQESCSTYVTY